VIAATSALFAPSQAGEAWRTAGRLLAVGPDLLALAADPATGEGPARSELRVDAVREGRVVIEFGHLHDEALDEDDVDDEPADLADESGQEG
jgi:hypothetical protein